MFVLGLNERAFKETELFAFTEAVPAVRWPGDT